MTKKSYKLSITEQNNFFISKGGIRHSDRHNLGYIITVLLFILMFFSISPVSATYIVASGTQMNVAAGTIWHPSGNVIVEANAKLIIEGTVLMDPNSKITIKRNGRLKVDRGRITAFNQSIFWAGIEVLGLKSNRLQPSKSDAINMIVNATVSDNKGAAYLNYAHITRSQFGIVAGEILYSSFTGNWVAGTNEGGGTIITNTTTYDSIIWTALYFAPFKRTAPSSNYTLDNNSEILYNFFFFRNFNPGYTGIYLNNVKFVTSAGNGGIYGNTFQNTNNPNVSSLYQAYGIGTGSKPTALYSILSGYRFEHNYINGFWYGVFDVVINSPFTQIIHNNYGVNNYYDVYATATHNLSVDCNEFVKNYNNATTAIIRHVCF